VSRITSLPISEIEKLKSQSFVVYYLQQSPDNTQLKQQVDNMQTIPGIGKTTAVAILAESPDLKSFGSARQLAAYAGLTPKHKTSGNLYKRKNLCL